MLQNDWMLQKYAEEQRRDLLRQLEHDRLIRQFEVARHPQRHRVYHILDWVGRQLITWGERLRARHVLYHQQMLKRTLGG